MLLLDLSWHCNNRPRRTWAPGFWITQSYSRESAPAKAQSVKDKNLQSLLKVLPIHSKYLFAGCYNEAVKQQSEILQKSSVKLSNPSAPVVCTLKRKARTVQKTQPSKRQKFPVTVTRTVRSSVPKFRRAQSGGKP